MENGAYIGESIAGLIFLVVGVRLLRLAFRTGENPERFLSASFLAWGLSYLLYGVPHALADESLVRPLYFVARLTVDAGIITFAFFTWSVFRKRDTWGLRAVAGTIVCLVVGVAGSVWVDDWEGIYPMRNPWWWVEWVGITATAAWMGAEGLVQYGKARQRLGLGLCDPLTRNRLLLWGLASTLWTALQFVFVVQSIGYETSKQWSAPIDALVGAIEITAGAMIWLAFFPPARYRRWVTGAGLTAAES